MKLVFFALGIKGWYPLSSANSVVISEISSDPIEQCVGGLELFIRFSQEDDRRRMIDSAKTLGWIDDNYIEDEHFLDGKFDLRRNKLEICFFLYRSKRSWMFSEIIY